MKLFTLAPTLTLILSAATTSALAAQQNPATFSKLTCRSKDAYELAGNQKVVEITLTRNQQDGTYQGKLFHTFETLQPNLQYKEVERDLKMDLPGLQCSQADPATDPLVIACSTTTGTGSYFGIDRVDITTIGSPSFSKPGEIIKTHRYEGLIFDNHVTQEGLADGLLFYPGDCVLN